MTELSEVLQSTTRELVLTNLEYNKNFQRSAKLPLIQDFISNYLNALDESEHNWRLPKNSVPISYDLHLISNIHSGSLAVVGEVTIAVRIVEATDVLTLHSRNLTIDELEVFSVNDGSRIPVVKISLYAPTDMLTIYLFDEVAAGDEIIIIVNYRFTMNDSPVQTGFYRTSYVSSTGARRLITACSSVLEISKHFLLQISWSDAPSSHLC